MPQLIASLNRLRPAVPLVLRVVLGGLFLWHGIKKFDGGIDGVEAMFEMWGVPLAALTAPLAALVEIVGGAALIAGVATRLSAVALSLVMLGALFYVKADLGIISSEPMPGAELDLSLLAGLVSLIFLGPGRYAVDSIIGLEPATSVEADELELASH